MAPTSTAVTKAERRRVAITYGHPWPWQVRELVEAHAVERDVDIRDLAERWACSERKLGE